MPVDYFWRHKFCPHFRTLSVVNVASETEDDQSMTSQWAITRDWRPQRACWFKLGTLQWNASFTVPEISLTVNYATGFNRVLHSGKLEQGPFCCTGAFQTVGLLQTQRWMQNSLNLGVCVLSMWNAYSAHTHTHVSTDWAASQQSWWVIINWRLTHHWLQSV